MLIPASLSRLDLQIDQLTDHIVRFTLAAIEGLFPPTALRPTDFITPR